jgi:outer membrane lipoprotein SlyB
MTRMTRILNRLAAAVAAFALAACATTAPPMISGNGVVNGIVETRQASTASGIAGSIAGALIGAGLGSLVGGGSGRTIATGVGAAVGSSAGGVVGSQADAITVWDVSIRFDDGIDRVIRTEQPPAFRPGSRVRVANNQIQPL